MQHHSPTLLSIVLLATITGSLPESADQSMHFRMPFKDCNSDPHDPRSLHVALTQIPAMTCLFVYANAANSSSAGAVAMGSPASEAWFQPFEDEGKPWVQYFLEPVPWPLDFYSAFAQSSAA